MAVSGCGHGFAASELPRFSFGLLNGEHAQPEVASTARSRQPRKRRRAISKERRYRAAARARGLIGELLRAKRFSTSQRMMLRRVYRRRVSPTAKRPLRARARVGDLVFFDNARDTNRNHQLDDLGSKVGVVLRVSRGRIHYIFLSGRRVRRGILDRAHPNQRYRRGHVANSYIRQKTRRDPSGTAYLAGQLLAGFAPAL